MYPTTLQTCEVKNEPSFEIITHKELRNRFPQNSSLLIVDMSHYDQLQSPGTTQQIPFCRKVYLVASSLPVVFAIDALDLQRNLADWYLEQVVDYLRYLRRIRIIQSLKSKNVIMFNLSTRQGPALDKGRLEVSFCHPLLDTKICGETFPLTYCHNGAEVFCVLDIAQIHSQKRLPELEFPGNCCTMKIRLSRRSYTRTFTSLVWFVERRFKNSRVYFCAIKTDKITKVNFYFLPKQDAADTQTLQTLVLSHIEISIGSPSAERAHSSASEFLQNIKKQDLNQGSENYRFNLRPVDYAFAGLRYLALGKYPPLQADSFNPHEVREQQQEEAASANQTDSKLIESLSQRIAGVPPAAQQEQPTPSIKRLQKIKADLVTDRQNSNNHNKVPQHHPKPGRESSKAVLKQPGLFREHHARTSASALASEPVELRVRDDSTFAPLFEFVPHSNPPNFTNAEVGETKLMQTCKGPVGFAGANQGSKDFSISTNSDKLKNTTINTFRTQPNVTTDPTSIGTRAIHQQSEQSPLDPNLTTSENIFSVYQHPPPTDAGLPQCALLESLDKNPPSTMNRIWGN